MVPHESGSAGDKDAHVQGPDSRVVRPITPAASKTTFEADASALEDPASRAGQEKTTDGGSPSHGTSRLCGRFARSRGR